MSGDAVSLSQSLGAYRSSPVYLTAQDHAAAKIPNIAEVANFVFSDLLDSNPKPYAPAAQVAQATLASISGTAVNIDYSAFELKAPTFEGQPNQSSKSGPTPG